MAKGFRGFRRVRSGADGNRFLIKDGKATKYGTYARIAGYPVAWGNSPSPDTFNIDENVNGYLDVYCDGNQWSEFGSFYFTQLIDTSKYKAVEVTLHRQDANVARFPNLSINLSSNFPPNVATGDRNYYTTEIENYSAPPITDITISHTFTQTTGMASLNISLGFSQNVINVPHHMYFKDIKLIKR